MVEAVQTTHSISYSRPAGQTADRAGYQKSTITIIIHGNDGIQDNDGKQQQQQQKKVPLSPSLIRARRFPYFD